MTCLYLPVQALPVDMLKSEMAAHQLLSFLAPTPMTTIIAQYHLQGTTCLYNIMVVTVGRAFRQQSVPKKVRPSSYNVCYEGNVGLDENGAAFQF